MMNLFLGLLIGLSFLFSSSLRGEAAEKREAVVELVDRNVFTLDGRFEEKAYAAASWQGGFTPFDLASVAGGTRFCLLTDGEMLYVAVEVEDKDGNLPIAKIRQRDGPAWRDDSIEILLQTGEDVSAAYQIILNADGVVADYALEQGGTMGRKDWDISVTVATAKNEQGWTVEMAIPLASLHPDPTRKSWGVQVIRHRAARKEGKPEVSVWAPVKTYLQDILSYGTAELPDSLELKPFSWGVEMKHVAVVRREDGYGLRLDLIITNRTAGYQLIKALGALDREEASANRTIGVAAGGRSELSLEIPLGAHGDVKGRLSLAIQEAIGGRRFLYEELQEIQRTYTPWELRMLSPGYRDVIFHSQNLKSIEAELELLDSAVEIDSVEGVFTGPQTSSLPVNVLKAEAGGWKFSIPGIEKLPEGDYDLEVTINGGGGAKRITRRITKLAPQKGEVWIDPLGIVYRDGEPLPAYGFCFGRWHSLRENRPPNMRMNLAFPVWAAPPFEKVKEVVGGLAEMGVSAALYVPTAAKKGRDGFKQFGLTKLDAGERADYLALIKNFRGDPNIIAYYLFDEPELHGLTPERLKEIYELFRQEDPYKPVIILNNTIEGIRNYLQACDISSPDRYPAYLEGRGSAISKTQIANFLKEIPLGKSSFQARWATLQAFSYGLFGVTNGRGPTALEMRSQQIMALIGGASGISWYSEQGVWEEPGVLASLPYLSAEFQWLFQWRKLQVPRLLECRLEEGIRAALFETKEGPVVMVVNSNWREVNVSLADQSFAAIKGWQELGGLSAPKSGETLLFKLPAHGAAVFVPEHFEGLDQSWAVVEAEEIKLREASFNPLNVAHLRNGAKAFGIGTSPKTPLMAMALINGMKDPRGSYFTERVFSPGMGVEVHLADSKALQQVKIIGSNLTRGSLEVYIENEWKRIAELKLPSPQAEIVVPLDGKTISKLRLLVEQVEGESLYGTRKTELKIRQIEAYE